MEHTPRGYPLPHRDNFLSDDVLALREAITRIDTDIGQQQLAQESNDVQFQKRLHRLEMRNFLKLGF